MVVFSLEDMYVVAVLKSDSHSLTVSMADQSSLLSTRSWVSVCHVMYRSMASLYTGRVARSVLWLEWYTFCNPVVCYSPNIIWVEDHLVRTSSSSILALPKLSCGAGLRSVKGSTSVWEACKRPCAACCAACSSANHSCHCWGVDLTILATDRSCYTAMRRRYKPVIWKSAYTGQR
jgi:hypothetical protein